MIKVFLIIILFLTTAISADNIHMKDGEIKKGIIIEEYSDRVILMDLDGRQEVLMAAVKKIEYDSKEQKYFKLGNKYRDQEKYQKALVYYKKALKENSDSKQIQDAILMIRGIIFRQKDEQQRKRLKRFKETSPLVRRYNGEVLSDKHKMLKSINYEREVEKSLGFTFKLEGEEIVINYVKPGSSAHQAKLRVGDRIIAIWGEKIKYKKIEDIQKQLAGEKFTDIKISIERRIVIIRGSKYWFQDAFNIVDAKFKFVYDGLQVYDVKKEGRADLAGLKDGDFVKTIEGILTKYMTIDRVKKKVLGEEGSKLEFIVARDVVLRRK